MSDRKQQDSRLSLAKIREQVRKDSNLKVFMSIGQYKLKLGMARILTSSGVLSTTDLILEGKYVIMVLNVHVSKHGA